MIFSGFYIHTGACNNALRYLEVVRTCSIDCMVQSYVKTTDHDDKRLSLVLSVSTFVLITQVNMANNGNLKCTAQLNL